jgi:cytidylate kinase
MKNNYIIAIDGPAASGKSTTAKKLAKALKYIYLDTGAMYRACALCSLKRNIEISDNLKLREMMDSINLEIRYTNDANEIFLDDENVSERIREDDISKLSSKIAVIGFVREKMVHLQRKLGEQGRVILDGRDIGTVVFPKADFKFFMKADARVRAQRRWEELAAKGIEVSLDEVEKDIIWRDRNDTNRTNAPLKKADDAIEIDTSKLSIDDQVKQLESIIVNGVQ